MSQVPESRLTSEEEYRNMFEAATDGLVIYDIGRDSVVEANPAAYEMHGYTRQEFIGLNPAVFDAIENGTHGRQPISARTPGFLIVRLDRAREMIVHDKAKVLLVDA